MPSVFIVIRFPLFFLVFPQTESQASTHSWGQVENEGPGAAMARMRWFRVTAAALTLLAGGCVPQASFEVAAVAAPQPPNEPPDEPQAMQARLIPQRQNIRRFACFAAAAYDSNALPASCNPYLAGWVLRDLPATVPLLFNLHYPGKYIVAMNHKTHEQIVAIRGTDNAQDWVTNFKIEQTFDPILRVKVHSGFAEYARAVRTA
ncbi:MAG TPA: hypothetical protein VHU15_17155, partial [Stellaceae bacterium]|nr:hypothetical protein [Stellaceae bacterium]